MDERMLEILLEINRQLRHDFMNHLQVIHGYLQLGKPQKAREYTLQAAKKVRRLDSLIHIRIPLVQTIFIRYATLLNSDKAIFEVRVEDDFTYWKDFDYEVAGLLVKVFDPFLEKLKKNEVQCKAFLKTREKVCIELSFWGVNDLAGLSQVLVKESENFLVSPTAAEAGVLLLVIHQK